MESVDIDISRSRVIELFGEDRQDVWGQFTDDEKREILGFVRYAEEVRQGKRKIDKGQMDDLPW